MEEELRDLLYKYMASRSGLNLSNRRGWQETLGAFAAELGLEAPDDIQYTNTVLSELWSMAIEGIVEPTWSDVAFVGASRYLITGFGLTKHGKALLEGPPIDRPNQYIDYLKEQVSAINDEDEVITYVRESLTAYNHQCYFAATVMLGIASERLFEILLDTYINFMPDPDAQAQFKSKITGKGISKQYEEFMKKLPDFTGSDGITGEDRPTTNRLRRDFGHAMKVTFDTIRSYRDYAAHPRTNGVVPRDVILMNLTGFPMFCQRLYNAIEWLKNKTTDESE